MNYKIFFTWKYVISLALSCIFFWSAASQAQTTFTQGIVSNGSTFLWFKPDTSITWVDVHFNTGGGQQNVRMTANAATGRFEQIISASPGTIVNYSFTYSINGLVGFDTAQFSAVVPGASSSKTSSSLVSSSIQSSVISSSLISSKISSSAPSSAISSSLLSSKISSSLASSQSSAISSTTSSSTAAIGITNGVVDNGSSVIIFLKPNNVVVEWADVHFTVNGGVQQNVRMIFNTANARFEQQITTTAGAGLIIDFSFTHQTTAGAVNTAAFNFTRVLGSSSKSSVVSSSVISSIRSSVASSSVISSIKSSVASSIASSTVAINVDRSLLVHDTATLQAADFSFRSTLQQLVNQLNALNPSNQTTVEQLFARMWDTQNTAPGHVAGGEKCTGVLNGFTNECRPQEGAQADNPIFFVGNYTPIALINRFDLRDTATFNDCGEYRVIYANQGGSRNFIIFEAQMPNPNPGVATGCLPIAQFWQNLSAENNASLRAASLRNFYFSGIPSANVRAVIDIRNYATGQVRTNMFMGGSWDLKEFKVGVDAQGVSMIKPVSVKSNPVAFLFNGNSTDSRAAGFQADFIANMNSLLIDFNSFSLTVAKDIHNNGQSHASGDTSEIDYGSAFFNTNTNAFQQSVLNKLAAAGSNLTNTQVMNRAIAMSCGGCHQPGTFGLTSANAIGPNQSWPNTLGFTHVSEFANAGVFPLSPALTDVFLPARLAGFNSFLSSARTSTLFAAPTLSVKTMSTPVSSSSSSSAPAPTFNKRAG